MKRFFLRPLLMFPAAALALSCASLAGPAYVSGVYEGAAEGYAGRIRVSVAVSSGRIARVTVLEHRETALIGADALAELSAAVGEAGSTRVDLVTGATESSEGFIAAVEDALSKAAGRR